MSYTWTDPTGAAVTIYSVDGSAGIMTLDNVDNEGTQMLATLDIEECEVTFAVDWVSGAAGTITPGVYYRAASDLATFFKVEFTIALDPLTSDVMTGITVSNETGVIGTAAVSKTHTIGVPFRVKVRSTTNHFVKVWSSNVAEPEAWDLSAGTGSLASGTVGLTALAALDAAVPDPLSNVVWMWGAETAVSGYGDFSSATNGQVISPTISRFSITALGQGADGVGRAAQITVAAQTGSFQAGDIVAGANLSTMFAIFKVRFVSSLPTGGTNNLIALFHLEYNGQATTSGISFRTTDSRLVFQPTSGSATGVIAGPVVVANTWYTVQLTSVSTANPYVFQWTVDGVAQTGTTKAQTAAAVLSAIFGPYTGNTTGTILFDDNIILSSTTQYPVLESISLKRLMPAATITQSGTVNTWCRFTGNGSGLDTTFNAADILAAITEYPPAEQMGSSETGVYQRITGTTSDFIALPTENYSLGAGEGVGAVRLYFACWTGTIGGNSTKISVSANVGGSSTTIFSNVFALSAATTWGASMYEPSGGWDGTKLDALSVSLQATDDISPLAGYRFIMTEVAILTTMDPGADTIDIEFDDFQVCSCEVD